MEPIIEKHRSGVKDPDYFKKYYLANNKGVQVPCPRCNKLTSRVNISKHLKRNICLKVAVVGLVEQICEEHNIHPGRFENNLKNVDI